MTISDSNITKTDIGIVNGLMPCGPLQSMQLYALSRCNNEIIIPKYDIDIKLQEGKNVIEFTPNEVGTFSFTCWMGMIKSTITVIN